jgi:hypothetical protein
MIENQLECCLEQSLVLRAEYDAHSALRARLDVVRVALGNYFEARRTMNKTELWSGEDLLSIAPICCLSSPLNEFHSREIILVLDGE